MTAERPVPLLHKVLTLVTRFEGEGHSDKVGKRDSELASTTKEN
jgi:hypothetical protein